MGLTYSRKTKVKGMDTNAAFSWFVLESVFHTDGCFRFFGGCAEVESNTAIFKEPQAWELLCRGSHPAGIVVMGL